MSQIRTRFAPSPTGYLHIGGLRTALFDYLLAKKNDGKFLLRIEDTDQVRKVEGAEENLIKILQLFGLNFDEEVVVQSNRIPLYQASAQTLISSNHAYYCFCSSERLDALRKSQSEAKQMPRYDGHCRNLSTDEVNAKLKTGEKSVIRFKLPENKEVTAQDTVYGEIKVKTEDLDDFVLIKSDGFPTYHLANVIDDHDMQISHVFRGEEWLASLPKHKLLYDAFGWQAPTFVHLPLLLNPDRSKLSKRQGDVAVEDFVKKGYLKEAILNYVALLGWNPKDDREFFTLDELVANFSLENINKTGAIFDIQKLNWFNASYIRENKSPEILTQAFSFLPADLSDEKKHKIFKLFSSRLDNLSQLTELASFIWQLPDYDKAMLIFKKSDLAKTQAGLNIAMKFLNTLADDDWQEEKLKEELNNLIAKNNLTAGDVFWPIRVALSGREQSPSPTEILEALGKEESLNRLKLAVDKLK